MTFTKSAWAIDGPIIGAAQARTEAYAANSGQEGVIQRGDLKVSTLAVEGNGLRIAAGAALILNRYKGGEGVSDEMYTVTNPDVHTITAGDMPAATVGETVYVVCVSVGDPEFSQVGHPWMLASDPPDGEETTFTYVRPILVKLSDFLVRTYPAVALATVTRPGGVTTITASMVNDIRTLARPRFKPEQAHVTAISGNPLNVPGGERWPNVTVLECDIPYWAVTAKITGFVEGVRLVKTGEGTIVPYIEGTALVGEPTNIDEKISGTANDVRVIYNFSAQFDVSDYAGTTQKFSLKGNTKTSASNGFLTTNASTSVSMSILFEEKPL